MVDNESLFAQSLGQNVVKGLRDLSSRRLVLLGEELYKADEVFVAQETAESLHDKLS